MTGGDGEAVVFWNVVDFGNVETGRNGVGETDDSTVEDVMMLWYQMASRDERIGAEWKENSSPARLIRFIGLNR